MIKRATCAAVSAAFLSFFLPVSGSCQTTLSQNSGINSSDTWVAFDVTLASQTTVNTSNAYYNPQTQTTSNEMPITPPLKPSTSRPATTLTAA
jgi:hypothetical protein